MNRFPILLMLILTSFFSGGLSAQTGQIHDMGEAREYCINNPLARIEGIWEFPSDNTVVLIKENKTGRKQVFELFVITTPDCRLHPGEKIGELTPSVDKNRYALSLYRSKRDGVLTDPGHCSALFNDKEGSIKIEKRKAKFSLNTRIFRLLPEFWRLVSMIKVDDPESRLPEGMVRVFPAPHTSKAGFPIYL